MIVTIQYIFGKLLQVCSGRIMQGQNPTLIGMARVSPGSKGLMTRTEKCDILGFAGPNNLYRLE